MSSRTSFWLAKSRWSRSRAAKIGPSLGDCRLAAVEIFPREVLVDAPRQPVVGTDDDLKRLAQVVPGHRLERDVKLVGAPEVLGDLIAVYDTLGLAHGCTYTA
jgi:hypothetical protein